MASQGLPRQDRPGPSQIITAMPSDTEPGQDRNINLRPGMSLVFTDFTTTAPFETRVAETAAPLEFCFCLKGGVRCLVPDLKEEFEITRGQCNISFFPHPRGMMAFPPSSRIHFLTLRITPQALEQMLKSCKAPLPGALTRIAQGRPALFFKAGPPSAAMEMAVHQIANCAYSGQFAALYLEGMAIELLAHSLDLLAAAPKPEPNLSARDMERIREARHLLAQDILNPPSLVELARKVGINDFKLKKGFRQLFGTTVFGFVHHRRMADARQMLQDGRFNVTEVAGAVGYTNPSHFAAAFRKRFGINPSALLTEARRNTSGKTAARVGHHPSRG